MIVYLGLFFINYNKFFQMQVKNLKGEKLEITSLWLNRKIVCGFLRHVGCRFCW